MAINWHKTIEDGHSMVVTDETNDQPSLRVWESDLIRELWCWSAVQGGIVFGGAMYYTSCRTAMIAAESWLKHWLLIKAERNHEA